MATPQSEVEILATQEYKYGFVTDIEQETVPPGLNEDVIRLISAKKREPEWLTEWRLKAFRYWPTMKEPTWANVKYGPLLFCAQGEGNKEARGNRPGAFENLRQARNPAERTRTACRRGGGCGV